MMFSEDEILRALDELATHTCRRFKCRMRPVVCQLRKDLGRREKRLTPRGVSRFEACLKCQVAPRAAYTPLPHADQRVQHPELRGF